MAERIQRTKQSNPKEATSVAEVRTPSEAGERLKAELDDILDEIDEVLEANAEDFVKSYIQKGGE